MWHVYGRISEACLYQLHGHWLRLLLDEWKGRGGEEALGCSTGGNTASVLACISY
jgi:hypothetical protein